MRSIRLFSVILLALCFSPGFEGIGMGQGRTSLLAVKEIALKYDERGTEKVTLTCSRACAPALFALGEGHPRIVMDLNGVASIEKRNYDAVRPPGKFVQRIRGYLDRGSGKLRIVLDMDASKDYLITPLKNQPANTFSIEISEQTVADRGPSETPQSPKPRRIRILIVGQNPVEGNGSPASAGKPDGVAPSGRAEKESSVQEGRALMDVGDYDGAIREFSRIIEKEPKNSLCRRLRGNAHASRGDREKAIGDWIVAARLGDETIQAYLDFLKVSWRGKSKP